MKCEKSVRVSCRIKRMQGVINSAMSGRPNEPFSEGADWPQDPGLDGPNTLCNAGLRPSPTPELLVLRASAWQWSTPSSLQQPHRPTRAARAQPGPAALALVATPALWLVRERNSAAPRSGRPSAPALQTRARFRHPLAEK